MVVLGWLVPLFIYVKARNKGMQRRQSHDPFASHLLVQDESPQNEGQAEAVEIRRRVPIQLEATGLNVDDQVKMLRTVESRNYNDSNGYNMLRELLYHALYARLEILIEFGADETKFSTKSTASSIRFMTR